MYKNIIAGVVLGMLFVYLDTNYGVFSFANFNSSNK